MLAKWRLEYAAYGRFRQRAASRLFGVTQPLTDPLFLAFQQALAGRYSIDRELGRGGMGIVYLAREVHLDRPVAIKLLPPERAAEPSLRERFLREARLAAKLSHPNVIPIYSVEEANGFVFYVMAYIEGETLAHRVRTRGPLPSSESVRVLREVSWALAHAHERGIVHRDVKPDNILLETATRRVLVGDFGIAAVAGDATSDGVAGTPEFMSPEQALGGSIDARSDLYAWGATAFYALSGRFPFEGATAQEILAKHVTESPPALGSLGTGAPRSLASLVDRCLAKDPSQRPESAHALAEQLGIAMEQRREMPAALRAFAKRQARLNGGGTVIAGFALVPASVVVASVLGTVGGFATFALGLTAAPFAYLTNAARRLMLLGFAHADIGPAFKAELEQAKEELAVERATRRTSSMLEQWLPRIAKTSAVLWAVDVVGLLALWKDPLAPALRLGMGFFGGGALLTAITLIAIRQRDHDVDTEFWAKVWTGRIGKLAFSVARKLLGNRTPAAAMTHRATELSLGLAAEQLYETLPRAVRESLGDLPEVLDRLQRDAQILRKRYDELQETLISASDREGTDEYTKLRAMRDAVHAKLGEAVSALETIRLELLRLHAGSTSVEGLTTHLGLASEVSSQVQRLVEARDEVNELAAD